MASVQVCCLWAVLRHPFRWQKCKQMAENDTYYRFLWHHLLITQLSPDLIIRQISAQVLPPPVPTRVKAFGL